jgi:hypothetical protein
VPDAEFSGIERYWNSRPMRKIRRQMLKGKLPEACQQCEHRSGPLYRHYNQRFADLVPQLMTATSWRGHLRFRPVSFDYRTSNLCNFKCRMCGSGYSSSWRSEAIHHDGDYSLPAWLREPNYSRARDRQSAGAEQELLDSIASGSLREIYWAGGEPLLMDFHWKAMQAVVKAGLAHQVFVRYNTNLSFLEYRGSHLFRDILSHFPSYEIGASLDATGPIGEYLRTGLNWDRWRENAEAALQYVDGRQRTFHIAFTLTLPGMLDLENMLRYGEKFGLVIMAQPVAGGDCHQIIDPLSVRALPPEPFRRLISETRERIALFRGAKNAMLFDELGLLEREGCWREKMSEEEYRVSLRAGFARIFQLEARRKSAPMTYAKIMGAKPYLSDWVREFWPERMDA